MLSLRGAVSQVAIRVGDTPARAWQEGRVMLFDDSFEHEAYNESSKPRLVLICDIWHPELRTDEQRLAALKKEEERGRYLEVVRKDRYENTVQRGH